MISIEKQPRRREAGLPGARGRPESRSPATRPRSATATGSSSPARSPSTGRATTSRDVHLGEPSGLAREARVNPYFWYGSQIETQTDYTLWKLEQTCEAAGTSLERAVKATVYIGHPNDFYGMDRAWRRWFPENPPARVVIPYMGLGGKGSRVEIALKCLAQRLAARDRDRRDLGRAGAARPRAAGGQGRATSSSSRPRWRSTRAATLAAETKRHPEFPWYGQPAKQQMHYVLDNVAAISEAAGTDARPALPPAVLPRRLHVVRRDDAGRVGVALPRRQAGLDDPRRRRAARRPGRALRARPDRLRAGLVEGARTAIWPEGDSRPPLPYSPGGQGRRLGVRLGPRGGRGCGGRSEGPVARRRAGAPVARNVFGSLAASLAAAGCDLRTRRRPDVPVAPVATPDVRGVPRGQHRTGIPIQSYLVAFNDFLDEPRPASTAMGIRRLLSGERWWGSTRSRWCPEMASSATVSTCLRTSRNRWPSIRRPCAPATGSSSPARSPSTGRATTSSDVAPRRAERARA